MIKSKLVAILLIGVVAACSTGTNKASRTNDVFNAEIKPDSANTDKSAVDIQRINREDDINTDLAARDITDFRNIPTFGDSTSESQIEVASRPDFAPGQISVLIPPQPIPDFIDTVFGELLDLGYAIDSAVSQRQEIVTYRSPPNISRAKLYASAQAALEPYGVAIIFEDGEVRVALQDDLLREAPLFIRARARASVPSNLRPIAKYIELSSIPVGNMEQILANLFPGGDDFRTLRLDEFGAIVLIGLSSKIDQAEQVIAQMDRVRFENSRVATITVRNWELAELTKVLEQQLSIEGFSISSAYNIVRAINLFPIEYTSQLIIFARDEEMLQYVVETAERLDDSARVDRDVRAYIYKARFYEASKLAEIITGQVSVDSGNDVGASASTRLSRTSNTSGLGAKDGAFSVNLTVDEQSNRLIYLASEEHHREISGLLRALDTPQDEVLIDVTIAEVTLTDKTSYGLDFLMSQIGSQGYSVGFGTGGGIGLTTGGLSGQYVSGDYTINFSALASNNQINILSSPRLVVKSGTLGSIQVGTDVPIITSQSASNTQIGGNTDVLQSVEYRETGILLDIEPLVLSNDRIDMKVSQEVSSAEENANQAIASPVISNRKIQTELTLQDGQSAIMGGLIENRYSRGSTGVPIAKDIPILGNLFKTETLNATRTMLLVMITPYVLSSRDDRATTVQTLTDAMNEAFENQVQESVTLSKPDNPFNLERE